MLYHLPDDGKRKKAVVQQYFLMPNFDDTAALNTSRPPFSLPLKLATP